MEIPAPARGTRKSSSKTPRAGRKTQIKLDHWFRGVQAMATAAKNAGQEIGACVVPDPTGGPDTCVQVDSATCMLLKGVFQGGPCF